MIRNLFQSFLVSYLLLLLIEQIWPKAVTLYLNLNYVLAIVIILGILDVFTEKPKEEQKPITWKDHGYIALLAVAALCIIKYKTVQLGWLSWVIALIAAALVALISYLILDEDEETHPHH